MKKVKLNKKNILIAAGILLLIILLTIFLVSKTKHKKKTEPKSNNNQVEKTEEPKEKIDVIDVNSKTRPFAVVINNTPIAVKVQTGLNKAYVVYEFPTEGATSRLMALYKDIDEDLKLGTIRSARHNFIDYAFESDAIFVAYGYSHYAEDELNKEKIIDHINGMIHPPFWRNNPEKLASEHTAYTSIGKLKDFAYNTKKFNKESTDAKNTVLLNYNVGDVDLSKKDNVMDANNIKIVYGNIVTKFKYNDETKMYTRIVNDKVATDHENGEEYYSSKINI